MLRMPWSVYFIRLMYVAMICLLGELGEFVCAVCGMQDQLNSISMRAGGRRGQRHTVEPQAAFGWRSRGLRAQLPLLRSCEKTQRGTHTMRRAKAAFIYRKTKNLRVVQRLLDVHQAPEHSAIPLRSKSTTLY